VLIDSNPEAVRVMRERLGQAVDGSDTDAVGAADVSTTAALAPDVQAKRSRPRTAAPIR
jgi:hypothetical protein